MLKNFFGHFCLLGGEQVEDKANTQRKEELREVEKWSQSHGDML